MLEFIFEEGVVKIAILGELAEVLNPASAPSFNVAATLKGLITLL